MRHVIETGTDGATLCFFDPAAVSPDFNDLPLEGDVIGAFEKLEKQGRLWWKSTGGDGGFLFHFYIDEDVPEKILKYSTDPQEIPRFSVLSGTIWACGAEYAAQNPLQGHKNTPKGGLAKYSHMGASFNLKPGEYQVTAWRTEWPEEMLDNEMEKRIGKKLVRRQNVIGTFTGVLLLGLLIATVISGCRLIGAKNSVGLIGWLVGHRIALVGLFLFNANAVSLGEKPRKTRHRK